MSWKNELRKKDKVDTAKRTPPSYSMDEIQIKDKDGKTLSRKKVSKLFAELMKTESKGNYKEILDEANVSMKEFTKYLLNTTKLPSKTMHGRKEMNSWDYPAV